MAAIRLENGYEIRTCPRPSPDFDPLTATSAELRHHGVPPRQEDLKSVQRYREVWGRIKKRFRYIEPGFRLEQNLPPRPRNPTFQPLNSNWSGAVVTAPAGQSFSCVQGEWIVPNVYAPNSKDEYWIGSWIGLDGYTGAGANDVLQAGVGQDVSASHRDINPWFEWYPNGPVTITNLPISPGDLVTVIISTPSGNDSTTATLSFANTTTGISTSMMISAPTGVELAGNSAEWIVEEPLFAPSLDTLPDYGAVFFSSCEAYIAGGGSVGGGTGTALNIIDNGSTISQGVLISPTIIQCSYTGPKP